MCFSHISYDLEYNGKVFWTTLQWFLGVLIDMLMCCERQQKKHIEFKEIQHLMDCTYHLLDCVPLKEGWPGSGWVRLHAPVCECGSFSVEPWISGFCFGASSLGFVLCKIQTLKKVNTLLFQGFFTVIFSFCHSVFLLQWFMSTLKIHRFILLCIHILIYVVFILINYLLKAIWKTIVPWTCRHASGHM